MTRGAGPSSADPTGAGSTLEGPAPYPPFVEALDALVAVARSGQRADSEVFNPPDEWLVPRTPLPPPRRVLPARRSRRPDRPADLRRPGPLVPRPPAALRHQVPADPVYVAAAHVRPG